MPSFGGLFGGDDDEANQANREHGRSRQPQCRRRLDASLADGSAWTQTDDAPLGLPPQRATRSSSARRAGQLHLSVNRQPGFKVKRIG